MIESVVRWKRILAEKYPLNSITFCFRLTDVNHMLKLQRDIVINESSIDYIPSVGDTGFIAGCQYTVTSDDKPSRYQVVERHRSIDNICYDIVKEEGTLW